MAPSPDPPPGNAPAIFHVTHYKAGSQWIHLILKRCMRDRLVHPRSDLSQFLKDPIQPGGVYSTLYVTREQFERVHLPAAWRRLIVIRDLRDTLVSGYFSLKVSHPSFRVSAVSEFRRRLQELSFEEGLIETLNHWLPINARIQESWHKSGDPLIRYEDLLVRDVEILERILIDEWAYPVQRQRLQACVESVRFERLSGGRARGEEDAGDHYRKGVAGDWRNYFTDSVKEAFKERWGTLLIATGYERSLDW